MIIMWGFEPFVKQKWGKNIKKHKKLVWNKIELKPNSRSLIMKCLVYKMWAEVGLFILENYRLFNEDESWGGTNLKIFRTSKIYKN